MVPVHDTRPEQGCVANVHCQVISEPLYFTATGLFAPLPSLQLGVMKEAKTGLQLWACHMLEMTEQVA